MLPGKASLMRPVAGSRTRATAMLKLASDTEYDEHAPQMNTPAENAASPLRKRVRAP